MNTWLVAAAVVIALTGLAHSVGGEWLIFRTLRRSGVVPSGGQPVLRGYQTRILWANWHLVTVLGWALAALLLWVAQPGPRAASGGIIERGVVVALLTGGSLVLWSNRGRHPGWIALWMAAALVLVSLR
ncbi:hypothetical protein ACS5PN_29100 [Roseateles sp. NT4]|uniref:hypothetical protein n=1 Tax=Roseateles sp. NT4 TaxID=3453715 RepID=UPI003EEDFA34